MCEYERSQATGAWTTRGSVHVHRVTTTTSASDVRVRITLREGVPEWQYHHRVAVEYNGAYGWRHSNKLTTHVITRETKIGFYLS